MYNFFNVAVILQIMIDCLRLFLVVLFIAVLLCAMLQYSKLIFSNSGSQCINIIVHCKYVQKYFPKASSCFMPDTA